MRKFHSTAAICALLIGAMPVVATAQANINTSRSNTKGSVAPTGDAVTADGSGEEQRAGRKGYDYYQAQSDTSAVAAEPADPGQPAGDQTVAGTTVPKQTQQATFGERVNAPPQQPGNAAGPETAPPAETSNQQPPRSLQDADRSMLSIIR